VHFTRRTLLEGIIYSVPLQQVMLKIMYKFGRWQCLQQTLKAQVRCSYASVSIAALMISAGENLPQDILLLLSVCCYSVKPSLKNFLNWLLKIGAIGCPKILVQNYHSQN